MKAVRVYEFGPGDLKLEVVIRVEAARGIFGDVLTRMGVDPRLPEV